MKVHLVDGTYELFRHFFGAPPHRTAEGEEVAAVRSVLSSVLQLIDDGATHVGVATDHVIESFRNDLWPGYKTGEGIDELDEPLHAPSVDGGDLVERLQLGLRGRRGRWFGFTAPASANCWPSFLSSSASARKNSPC